MKYKAILFDLGNTLIYFSGKWQDVFASSDKGLWQYLTDQGLSLDQNNFTKEIRNRISNSHVQRDIDFIEFTTAKILKRYLSEIGYENFPDDKLNIALEHMYQHSQSCWIPEKDVTTTLETLKNNGLKLGIVSNASNNADVQLLVEKAKIRPYLDFAISSADWGVRKPSPTIFNHALSNWPGISSSEVVMVGDTLNADILGANNMGIYSVWYTKRVDSEIMQNENVEIQANEILYELKKLPELIYRIS